MEKRRLGRTDHMSTVVTFGSAGIGRVGQDVADQAVDVALKHGVNHFDVAPSYGEAELRLGPWMPRIRDQIFLGCKTQARTKAGAWDELRRSLDRLRVDRFDLYQLHAVGTVEELDKCTGPGGAMEAIVEARDQGLTRWIGITGHGHDAPATHAEALRRFDFDTVMLPLNFILYADPRYRADFDRLIAMTQAKDVGVHILKSVAKGPWGDQQRTHTTWYEPFADQSHIDEAVSFVLSQPVTTICSAGDVNVLPMVLDAAERYRPMLDSSQRELLATASQFASPFVG
jgi:aryl-alcohol dehydrogenase-like predicted oxidoreductase